MFNLFDECWIDGDLGFGEFLYDTNLRGNRLKKQYRALERL
jgi:hypothetical protein